MNLGEFVVKLGFSADTLKLKDFTKAIGDIPVEVASSIAALAGFEYELMKLTEQAIETAVGFQLFTNETGLSWKELQKWQIVAQQANVSAESMTSSVEALEHQMAEIRLGRGNIAPFQMLGIGVNQSAFQALDQIRQRIQGLDKATATNLITQMGLTPEMMNVLTLTNQKFGELSRTVSGLTGEQEGSLLRAKEQLTQFGLVAKYIGFDVVTHLIDDFELLLDGIKRLQLWIPGLIVAASALTIAFAPWTAGIIAFMLILDDLATYFRGGDSVIGLAIEGIKKLGAALSNVAINKIAPFLGQAIGGLGTAMALAGGSGVVPIRTITQTNNIHVQSTAPAHDVGKAVKHEIDKGVSAAALQTDNQGY